MSKSTNTLLPTGVRESNFELLRIISIILVLILHANFRANGGPVYLDFVNNPVSTWFATLIESVSIVAVNVFVMISGWFGIKPSLKGFGNLIFQCIYIYGIVYICMMICGETNFSLRSILSILCLTEKTGWFIKAYIALYIFSPILNLFIEKTSKKQLKYFLICFYLYQTIYGIKYGVPYLVGGYSPISFIGLYILSGYIKRYNTVNYKWGGVVYILCSIVLTIECYVCKRYNLAISTYQYLNPLVVISSAGLIVWINGFNMNYNCIINFLSRSVFAIYLFHVCPLMPEYYLCISRCIYTKYSGLEYLGILTLFIVLVFIAGVIIDQPRKWIWRKIKEV